MRVTQARENSEVKLLHKLTRPELLNAQATLLSGRTTVEVPSPAPPIFLKPSHVRMSVIVKNDKFSRSPNCSLGMTAATPSSPSPSSPCLALLPQPGPRQPGIAQPGPGQLGLAQSGPVQPGLDQPGQAVLLPHFCFAQPGLTLLPQPGLTYPLPWLGLAFLLPQPGLAGNRSPPSLVARLMRGNRN